MLISCKNCDYTREMDDSQVPEWAVAVKCPKCGHRIDLDKDSPLEFLPREPDQSHTSGPDGIPAAQPSGSLQAARVQPPPPVPPLPDNGMPTSGTPDAKDIPWESRTGGFFHYFISTVRMVLFKPDLFFYNMKPAGGYARPMVFMVIMGYVTALITVIFSLGFEEWGKEILNGIQGSVAKAFWSSLLEPKPSNIYTIIFMIFGPLLNPLILFIFAGIMYGFLPSSVRKRVGFQPAYRVAAYTSATTILGVIPVIGGIVMFFWDINITMVGLARVYKTSKGTAFWSAIAPFIVFLGLGIIGYMMLISIIGA